MIDSLAALLHPLTPETFFRDYFDRAPVLIEGAADKFADVLSWGSLTELLNMSALWSSDTVVMKRDVRTIPAEEFCVPTVDRRNQNVLQPDPARMMALITQGASFGLNRIDSFTPGLRAVAEVLEQSLYGRAQANLYCSRKEHQAFGVHPDTHDVFAVHLEGEKEWVVYEGREEWPINHPQWKNWPLDVRKQRCGREMMRFVMKPGDLLYLPRGQYHEALSRTDGCVHVAFGVTYVIGYDVVSMLQEQAMGDPLIRQNLPHPDAGPEVLAARLREIGEHLLAMAAHPQLPEMVRQYQDQFRGRRGGFQLPVETPPPAERAPDADQLGGPFCITPQARASRPAPALPLNPEHVKKAKKPGFKPRRGPTLGAPGG